MRISDWSSDVCSSDLFVTTVNAVHRQGVDLNGQPGADLFATSSLAATPSRTNVGQATLRMEVTDQTQVFPGGYELRYDGTTSQWTRSRTDGSAQVSGTGAPDLDGVHLDLGGAPGGGAGFPNKGQPGAGGRRVLDRRRS